MKPTKGFAKYFANSTNPALAAALAAPPTGEELPMGGINGTFGFGHNITARENETGVINGEIMELYTADDFGRLMQKDIDQARADIMPDFEKYSPTIREQEMLIDAELKGNNSPEFTKAVLQGTNAEVMDMMHGGTVAEAQFFNQAVQDGGYGSEQADAMAVQNSMPTQVREALAANAPQQHQMPDGSMMEGAEHPQPQEQPQQEQPPQPLSDMAVPLQLHGTLGMLSGQ